MTAIHDLLAALGRMRFGIALFGLLATTTLLGVFHAKDAGFHALDDRATALLSWQAELERALGYGGFIHHFGAFVFTGAPSARLDAQRDLARAESVLAALEAAWPHEHGREAVMSVRESLRDYAAQLEVAAAGHARALAPREITLLADVDDRRAVEALRTLLSQALDAAITR
jgi:hypothetical protein